MFASCPPPKSAASSGSPRRPKGRTRPSSGDQGATVAIEPPAAEASTPKGRRFPLPPGVRGDADFASGDTYRYWLERRWDTSLPQFTYVLLNPSSAGANEDDPTTKKLQRMTVAQGGGGYELVNLFALIDTQQLGLHFAHAVGKPSALNDEWTMRAAARADVVVL